MNSSVVKVTWKRVHKDKLHGHLGGYRVILQKHSFAFRHSLKGMALTLSQHLLLLSCSVFSTSLLFFLLVLQKKKKKRYTTLAAFPLTYSYAWYPKFTCVYFLIQISWWRLRSLVDLTKSHGDRHTLTFPGDRNHATVAGLTPFSEYSLIVMTFNGRGNGPGSHPVNFKTPEGGRNVEKQRGMYWFTTTEEKKSNNNQGN